MCILYCLVFRFSKMCFFQGQIFYENTTGLVLSGTTTIVIINIKNWHPVRKPIVNLSAKRRERRPAGRNVRWQADQRIHIIE